MNLAGLILKSRGWKFVTNVELPPKCIICVAPHTSNWDFILGELCIRSKGMKAGFLMKDTWFFFPLGLLLRKIGGVPVAQHRRTNVSSTVVESLKTHDKLAIAVTPEGTRSLNAKWHKGFLYIAHEANVPVILAYVNYPERIVCIDREFMPTGDVDADMEQIKRYYNEHGRARFPEKFSTGL